MFFRSAQKEICLLSFIRIFALNPNSSLVCYYFSPEGIRWSRQYPQQTHIPWVYWCYNKVFSRRRRVWLIDPLPHHKRRGELLKQHLALEEDVFHLVTSVGQRKNSEFPWGTKNLSPHEDIADPNSMQDACHLNFVIDLAHRRVSVA